jgi:serine/threonine protein kinase
MGSDADRLLAGLVSVGALDPQRAGPAVEEFAADHQVADRAELVEFLVGRRLLTPFQAERVLDGGADRLLFGPFLLVETVAAGPSGTVYLAAHRKDCKRYAVRVLPAGHPITAVQLQRFRSILVDLPPHPGVVSPEEFGAVGGADYLAWPFVDGETLEHSVTRVGPLPPHAAARLFAELADGLAACHAAGIPHGGVRPSSLLIGLDRRLRVLELGRAAVGNVTATAYTAPEIRPDPTAVTQAADVYALGGCLHFALTGADPSVRPPDLRVPPALAEVIDLLMQEQPGNRPTNLLAVRDTIRMAAPPVAATPPPTTRPPAPEPPVAFDDMADDSRPVPPPVEQTAARRSDRRYDPEAIDFDELPPAAGDDWNERDSWPSARMEPAAEVEPVSLQPADTESPVKPVVLPASVLPPAEPPRPQSGPVTASRQFRPAPAPVNTESSAPADPTAARPPVVIPAPPAFARPTNLAARSLMFWAKPTDAVQLSVFGPPKVAPGQKAQVLVYAHRPEAFDGVATLCRALHPWADLLGAGFIDRPVGRGTEVGLHLAVSHAGVAKSKVGFTWSGQTQPRTFELFVPWESPPGLASGVVSADLTGERASAVQFHFVVPPRSS